jgi:L-2-hydroxycarboxylate dehydrogenase (NAD+)
LPNRGKKPEISERSDVRVDVRRAIGLTVEILTGLGVSSDGAALQGDLWIAAEAAGLPSHGLLRLPNLAERIRRGLADPRATGEHTWTGEAFLRVDGQQGLGPVVLNRALDAAADRARRTGAALAAVSQTNHLGMLAWYARRLAAEGFTVIGTTTSEALVHPWGGTTAMVGTNPLVVGVPAEPDPVVLDMSTGLVSMGKIKDHAERGLPLQPGWALDAAGHPTVDAVAAQSGSIAPFGGAKGYGLGLALEVLVATLTATGLGRDVHGTLDAQHAATKGDVFLVVDSRHSGQVPSVSAYLEAVRRSPALDPALPVRIPGDRARQQRERAERDGLVVASDLWGRLLALREEVHPSPTPMKGA